MQQDKRQGAHAILQYMQLRMHALSRKKIVSAIFFAHARQKCALLSLFFDMYYTEALLANLCKRERRTIFFWQLALIKPHLKT